MVLSSIGFIFIFILILASGLPVGFGLGFLAMGMVTMNVGVDTGLSMIVDKGYSALDSSLLVSLPMFIFTAQLISENGMGKRLFDAAKIFLGRFKAGLGVGTIFSSALFAAMTGSSFVSAATMGLIGIPELRKARYSDALISATITAGGSLGSIIPPSILLILYGFLTDESIAKLFIAGVIPGIILVILYSLGLIFLVKRENRQNIEVNLENEENKRDIADNDFINKVSFKDKCNAIKDSFWGIMAPVIILGGISFGIFTATEAAAIAVIYCIFIGFIIYRSLTIKQLFTIMLDSTLISAMVAMIIIGGAMIAHVIVLGQIPQKMVEFIMAENISPMLLMITINLFLFILGMFLEILALVYIAVPLLYPLVVHMGWDNIWFAVIILLNVNLALITPPMGGVLFIVSQIGRIAIPTVIKGALFPITLLIFVLILVIMFPALATWLPHLLIK